MFVQEVINRPEQGLSLKRLCLQAHSKRPYVCVNHEFFIHPPSIYTSSNVFEPPETIMHNSCASWLTIFVGFCAFRLIQTDAWKKYGKSHKSIPGNLFGLQ